MNAKLLLIMGGVCVGIAAPMVAAKILWDRRKEAVDDGKKSPYAGIIQENLRNHAGEDSPFVRAFEQALA